MTRALIPPPSIAKALVAAQKGVKAVRKASHNPHHGYDYASAQDVAAEAQRALNAAGLALSRVGWTHQPLTEHEPARLIVTYLLVSEAGESWLLEPVSVPSIPGKGRPEDKAEAGALTYSAGYVAQGLLQIERVDEHDPDARNDNDDGDPEPPSKASQPQAGPALSVRARTLLTAMTVANDPKSREACTKSINDAWKGLSVADQDAIRARGDELGWTNSRR